MLLEPEATITFGRGVTMMLGRGVTLILVVFLLRHLANARHSVRLVRERPWWLLFWFGARFDRPCNRWDYCLQNWILNALAGNVVATGLFIAVVAWTLLSLAVTPLREESFVLLYPQAVLSLVPMWLIDRRYCIAAVALFVLLRERRSWQVESVGLAWSMLLSLLALGGTFNQGFFL